MEAGGETEAVLVSILNIIDIECETAWAANGDEPGKEPYNPGRGGNWATYLEYDGTKKTVSIFADQDVHVGFATLSVVSEGEVEIEISLLNEFNFCSDGEFNVYIQGYDTQPSGNPSPGKFEYKVTFPINDNTIVVDEAKYYGIHLNVY